MNQIIEMITSKTEHLTSKQKVIINSDSVSLKKTDASKCALSPSNSSIFAIKLYLISRIAKSAITNLEIRLVHTTIVETQVDFQRRVEIDSWILMSHIWHDMTSFSV